MRLNRSWLRKPMAKGFFGRARHSVRAAPRICGGLGTARPTHFGILIFRFWKLPLGEELTRLGHCFIGMKIIRAAILYLLLGTALPGVRAQEVATNVIASLIKPAPATKPDVYHLDTSFGCRWPLNGDYRWLMPAMISFGKMLDDHNALDAVFGGGVIELKPGSQADAQAHQPFFLELGVAWKYYFAAREAYLKPYVTTGASLLWMSWEYRNPVDSPNYGVITRDYLEGADGYAGLGLRLHLRKHLECFGEMDAGGVGFLSTTYSGEHNNLFANFGYIGVRGGLSLTF